MIPWNFSADTTKGSLLVVMGKWILGAVSFLTSGRILDTVNINLIICVTYKAIVD